MTKFDIRDFFHTYDTFKTHLSVFIYAWSSSTASWPMRVLGMTNWKPISLALWSISIIPTPPPCLIAMAFARLSSLNFSIVQITILPLINVGSRVLFLQKLLTKEIRVKIKKLNHVTSNVLSWNHHPRIVLILYAKYDTQVFAIGSQTNKPCDSKYPHFFFVNGLMIWKIRRLELSIFKKKKKKK